MRFKRRIPLILQAENTECGLACLAMVLNGHGAQVNLAKLRQEFEVPLRGTSIPFLKQVAEHYRFSTKTFYVSINQLSTLKLPAILHWNHNHYVVLTKIQKNTLTFHDPALGITKISYQDIEKSFSGVALEFAPMEDFKPLRHDIKKGFEILFQLLPTAKRAITPIVIFSLLIQLFVLLIPFLLQVVIDHTAKLHEAYFLPLIIVGFISIKLLETGMSHLRAFSILNLEKNITRTLAETTFYRLIQLPLAYFERRQMSSILSKYNVIERIREIITRGLPEGIVDGIISVITLGLMIYYQPLFAAIVVLMTAAYFVFRYCRYHYYHTLNEVQLQERMKENAILMEVLKAILPIKIFSREKQFTQQWKNQHLKLHQVSFQIAEGQVGNDLWRNIMTSAQLVLIVVMGLIGFSNHHISIGILYAFIFYLNQYNKNIYEFVNKLADLNSIEIYMDRLNDILLQPTAHAPKATQKIIDNIESIQLSNVSFRYHPTEPWVLTNINMRIQKGECVVITGASGIGKTTLLKIMMGLLSSCIGEIQVNGLPLENIKDYQGKIAAVMQEDQLFSGTIAENISLFEDEMDWNRLKYVATIAHIDHDIENMPMKYHTFVGDMGTTLSGGQKQRILLARALYKMPQVLFLDEATSHLDTANEKKINQSLKQLGMIRVMIAHRQETIKMADRIIDLSYTNELKAQMA